MRYTRENPKVFVGAAVCRHGNVERSSEALWGGQAHDPDEQAARKVIQPVGHISRILVKGVGPSDPFSR